MLRRGHQHLEPEHLLKALLEDLDGFCATLIRAAGRDPKVTLSTLDAELKPLPKGESHRAGQVCLSPGFRPN
jgi:ATP-dependent Clp protease ATP-binding subunit ClpB